MRKKMVMVLAGAALMISALGMTVHADETKISIGATFYTLQTEFCMRMDNYAQKYCAEISPMTETTTLPSSWSRLRP